jgi:tetratricopeptide (TPR) repeat protein
MENITTLQEHLERANEARAQGKYWQAIQHYTDYLSATVPESVGLVHDLRLEALVQRGDLLHQLGEPEAALAGYNQYYLEAGSSEQAVDALVRIGEQQANMGDYYAALDAHREALHLAEALNITAGRAKALKGMGSAMMHVGRTEEAAENLRRALALFSQLGDDFEAMRAWNTLGITYSFMGAPDKAIQAYKEALQTARTVGERQTALTLSNIGECFQDLYNLDQALQYHQEALEIAESLKLESVRADLRRNLGADLCLLGRLDEGLPMLYRSLEISRAMSDPEVEMQALFSLTWAELRNERPDVAFLHASQLLTLSEQHKTRLHRARALHVLGLYHFDQGEIVAAQEMWQRALFLAHETNQRLLLWRIHANMAKVAPNEALAAVHWRIAGEVVQQILEPIEDQDLRQGFLDFPLVNEVLAHLPAGALLI